MSMEYLRQQGMSSVSMDRAETPGSQRYVDLMEKNLRGGERIWEDTLMALYIAW